MDLNFCLQQRRRISGKRAALGAALAAFLLCVAACHPIWNNRHAKLTGDFGSHTLYQSFMVVGVLLLLWHGWRSAGKRLMLWPLAVSIVTPLCVEGLKRITRFPRPDGEPTGFPSGHTTYAFGLSWLLTLAYPRLSPLWFGITVAIGWSRMEGLAHYPYQVLCGAALGTLIGWGTSHFISSPITAKEND